jgi:hypothetical protein
MLKWAVAWNSMSRSVARLDLSKTVRSGTGNPTGTKQAEWKKLD